MLSYAKENIKHYSAAALLSPLTYEQVRGSADISWLDIS